MAIYIKILEVDSDVVMSGSGSANTAALTIALSPGSQGANIMAELPLIALYGTVNSNVNWYQGVTLLNPNMGPGNGGTNYSFTWTGDNSFGVTEQGSPTKVAYLYLPVGYVSNSDLGVTTAVYTNKSFSTLGLNTGIYTWTWGSGSDADSITVQVGDVVTPTPTPTSSSTPTPTPTPTSSSTPTPTPTSSSTPTPTSSSTPTPTPTSTTIITVLVISANTEYVECKICDGVATTRDTPHPVYTNNQGNEVIQMNAVVIGGNGLNS
jgi:cell division septation protein DedD